MTAVNNTPTNKNFLAPTGFNFLIQKIPNVNYFCTSANIPDISLNVNESSTPLTNLKEPGDKISFSDLQIVFQVDEDMVNFKEIYDWMISIGTPQSFTQKAKTQANIFSDGSLLITNSNYTANKEIKFLDMFPSSLSALQFEVGNTDIEYLQAFVTFSYREWVLQST